MAIGNPANIGFSSNSPNLPAPAVSGTPIEPIQTNRTSSSGAFAKTFGLAAKAFPKFAIPLPIATAIPKLNIQQILDLIEKRKRELEGGGGGGGSIRRDFSKDVRYSLKWMAYKMNQFIKQLNIIDAKAFNFAAPAQVTNFTNAVVTVAKNVAIGFATLTTGLATNLLRAPKNILDAAMKLSSNAMNLATVAANSLINKVLKLISKALGMLDLEEEQELDEDNLANRLLDGDVYKSMLVDEQKKQDNNQQSVLAHIRNLADQITKLLYGN